MANQGICKGISISRNTRPISHLMFADDCYLFNEFKLEEVCVLQKVLEAFCTQSGQIINKNKSEILVSPNMPENERDNLQNLFQIPIRISLVYILVQI